MVAVEAQVEVLLAFFRCQCRRAHLWSPGGAAGWVWVGWRCAPHCWSLRVDPGMSWWCWAPPVTPWWDGHHASCGGGQPCLYAWMVPRASWRSCFLLFPIVHVLVPGVVGSSSSLGPPSFRPWVFHLGLPSCSGWGGGMAAIRVCGLRFLCTCGTAVSWICPCGPRAPVGLCYGLSPTL